MHLAGAYIAALDLGKTARLCAADSAYMAGMRKCRQCFDFRVKTMPPSQAFAQSMQQDVQQFQTFCDENYPDSGTTSSTTSTRVFIPLPFESIPSTRASTTRVFIGLPFGPLSTVSGRRYLLM